MGQNLATSKQVPDHAIMDYFWKQVFLANQYSVAVSNTSAGTSEVPLILINNTNAPLTQPSIFVCLKKIVSLTAGDSGIIRCYLNPTVSAAGTAATIVNQRPGNTMASPTAIVTTGPSVTGNGTLVDVVSAPAIQSGSSQSLQILDAGQSMLITITASASSAVTETIIGFYEI